MRTETEVTQEALARLSRATRYRVKKRGYIIIDYHRKQFREQNAAFLGMLRIAGKFSKKIWRVNKDLSIRRLALAMDVKEHRIRRWLTGESMPQEQYIPRLQKYIIDVLHTIATDQTLPEKFRTGLGEYTLESANYDEDAEYARYNRHF